MSAIVELSLFPIGREISVAPYVRRALAVIRESGLAYETNSMGTCIEGELGAALDVVRACHDELAADCERIYMTIKVDSKPHTDSPRMAAKVDAVR